jgi:hypothetical protein
MGSATDLNSKVPTHVEANRGVKTMWFLGDTHTTSYKSVSIPFISLHPAQPEPSTTTLGFSSPLVGSRPAYLVGVSVVKWESEVKRKFGFCKRGLDLEVESWIRFLKRDMDLDCLVLFDCFASENNWVCFGSGFLCPKFRRSVCPSVVVWLAVLKNDGGMHVLRHKHVDVAGWVLNFITNCEKLISPSLLLQSHSPFNYNFNYKYYKIN